MHRLIKVLFLTLLIAICSSTAVFVIVTHRYSAKADDIGDRERSQTINVDGRERSYLLHLPPGYLRQNSLPLVIMLHGGGGNSNNAERMSGLSEKADKEGFIVVYPNGNGRFQNRMLTWNAGNCCAYALDQDIDDVGFISALIDKLILENKVDKKRVFVTGMSNGGMMSYRLGCELSDKIAAIAPVAGALNVKCTPSSPVSVVIFHGTEDQHVLYEGGKPRVKADYHDRVDNSVANAAAFWVKHNHCDSNAKKEQQGNIITETYSNGKDSSAVKVYTINGGGHSWPGGQKGSPRGDEPNREISATDLMWDFFRQHPKK